MINTSSKQPASLQTIIAGIVEIDQAGQLDGFLADAWHYIHAEAEDRDHCTLRHRLYIDRIADAASRLLGTPRDECAAVATEVILNTRLRVVADTVSDYLREIHGEDKGRQNATPTAIARANRHAAQSRTQKRRQTA
jgi:hypothetical protein